MQVPGSYQMVKGSKLNLNRTDVFSLSDETGCEHVQQTALSWTARHKYCTEHGRADAVLNL